MHVRDARTRFVDHVCSGRAEERCPFCHSNCCSDNLLVANRAARERFVLAAATLRAENGALVYDIW